MCFRHLLMPDVFLTHIVHPGTVSSPACAVRLASRRSSRPARCRVHPVRRQSWPGADGPPFRGNASAACVIPVIVLVGAVSMLKQVWHHEVAGGRSQDVDFLDGSFRRAQEATPALYFTRRVQGADFHCAARSVKNSLHAFQQRYH